jgi:hypothetical protein
VLVLHNSVHVRSCADLIFLQLWKHGQPVLVQQRKDCGGGELHTNISSWIPVVEQQYVSGILSNGYGASVIVRTMVIVAISAQLVSDDSLAELGELTS